MTRKTRTLFALTASLVGFVSFSHSQERVEGAGGPDPSAASETREPGRTPTPTPTETPSKTPTALAQFDSGETTLSGMDGPTSVKTVDVNSDQFVDIVYSAFDGNEVGWFKNLGGGGFSAKLTAGEDLDGPLFISIADIDSDYLPDIVVADPKNDRLVWYENATRSTAPHWSQHDLTGEGFGTPHLIRSEDLDGNRIDDILVSTTGSPGKLLWLKNEWWDSERFISHEIHDFGDEVTCLALGDLDDDFEEDLIVGLSSADTIIWLRRESSQAVFEATSTIVTTQASGVQSIEAADLNQDGSLDIVAVCKDDNSVVWFENDGGATPAFEKRVIATSLELPYALAVHDIDLDGDLDVIIGCDNSTSAPNVLFFENINNAESWIPRILSTTDFGIRSVAVADFDRDLDFEIVAASYPLDKIIVYENVTPKYDWEVLRPDSNQNAEWTHHDFSAIDDNVLYPGYSLADSVTAEHSDGGTEQRWGFSDPAVHDFEKVTTLNCFVHAIGASSTSEIALYLKDEQIASHSIIFDPTPPHWYLAKLVGEWTPSELVDLRVGITAEAFDPEESLVVHAVYCQIYGMLKPPKATPTPTNTPTPTFTPTPFAVPDAVWQSKSIRSASDADVDRVDGGESYYVLWGDNLTDNSAYMVRRQSGDGPFEIITPTPVFEPTHGRYYFEENIPSASADIYHYEIRPGSPYMGVTDFGEENEPWKGGMDVVGPSIFSSSQVLVANLDSPKDFILKDLDLDGTPDLLIAESGNGTISWRKANGDGTFAAPAIVDASLTGVDQFALCYLNYDPFYDLVAVSSTDGILKCFISNFDEGDGLEWTHVFTDDGNLAMPTNLHLRDLNLDGREDIFLLDLGTHEIVAYETVEASAGEWNRRVVHSDLRGTRLSLATANVGCTTEMGVYFSTDAPNTVSYLLHEGDWTFSATPVVFDASPGNVVALRSGFSSFTGLSTLYVLTDRELVLHDYTFDGTSCSTFPRTLFTGDVGSGAEYSGYRFSELDNDLRGDVLVWEIHAGSSSTSVFWMKSLLDSYLRMGERTIEGGLPEIRRMEAADLDGDLDRDVLGLVEADGAIYWWENELRFGTPTPTPSPTPTPTPGPGLNLPILGPPNFFR